MKVSLVIPAKNEESCIAETIKAALAIEYPDFEVIVVNNNSTDRTAEIAGSFPEVKVVSETIPGANAARECGRKNATGDIIATMDADCLPGRDWLTRGTVLLMKPGVVALSGPDHYYDSSGFFKFIALFVQKTVYVLVNIFLNAIGHGGILIANNTLIRREVLEKAGGFNTAIVFYGDDTDTAQRVSRFGKIIFSPSFIMKTSGRRFERLGIVRTFGLYIYHFVTITVKGGAQK